MNANPLLMELKTVMGYPVEPDIYTGRENKYIVFTYEDERSALDGDNEEEYTVATIQVTLYTPATYNYMADKHKLKKALKSLGFNIEYCSSWVEGVENGTDYMRHTVFVVNKVDYTEV